jgi:hypothetical protein
VELKERNAKVIDVEKNGEFLSVEYTREDGQRVIGMFKRFGWETAPREIIAEVNSALRQGPIATAGLR